VIVANLKYLIPLLKDKSKINSGGGKDAVHVLNAELHIVTIGQEPAVRACVFSSGTSPPKKLLHSAESSDATSALNSLLKKTQSMLAAQFGVRSNVNFKVNSEVNSSMSTKVGSATVDFFSSATTKVADSKFSQRAAPTCEAPVAKVTASKAKSKATAKRARNKSTIGSGFWDSSRLNNTSFEESCGELTSGGDSGFLSRDGDPHPNRSYHDLLTLTANTGSIQHARVMAEFAPAIGQEAASGFASGVALEVASGFSFGVASEVACEGASERVSLESDKFF
jgi:hypothetical protein